LRNTVQALASCAEANLPVFTRFFSSFHCEAWAFFLSNAFQAIAVFIISTVAWARSWAGNTFAHEKFALADWSSKTARSSNLWLGSLAGFSALNLGKIVLSTFSFITDAFKSRATAVFVVFRLDFLNLFVGFTAWSFSVLANVDAFVFHAFVVEATFIALVGE
jgi:hypothetical protein